MQINDISLKNYPPNLGLALRESPPSTTILVYFNGPAVLIKLVDRLYIMMNNGMG